MRATAGAGVSGVFRFVRHGVADVRGSGPNGEVTFDDLWERRGAELVPKSPEKIIQDVQVKNKITKRGLSRILHQALIGHPGGPYVPADITANQTVNPFLAFFVAGDHSGGGFEADAKVLFNESDGTNDTKVPTNPALAGKGRRAILLSTTTGTGMKRTSIAYPTTNPYREIEYVIYAQASTYSQATGSITADGGNLPANGKIMTLNDGIHTAVVFEFNTGAASGGHVLISTAGSPTSAQLAARIALAINSQAEWLNILATYTSGSSLSLTHTTGGAIGAQAITNNFTPLGSWAISGMTGGSASETADAAIDNLAIKAVGLAAGVACGSGEASNQIGVRSVLGLPPMLVGAADRLYQHEATLSLHKYVTSETIGGVGTDGYVQSGNEESTVASIASSGQDAIEASNTVFMANANFRTSMVGMSLDIAGSGSNNGRKTIATVISAHRVTTTQTLTPEGNGFTATLITSNEGWGAFDADVDAEALTGLKAWGYKWRSANSAGPHHLGRIWATDKTIRGIRIVGPAGTPENNYLNLFKVQYLDQAKAGGNPAALEPANNSHWTDVGAEMDFTGTSQEASIFGAGDVGYEYTFNSNVSTRGIRIMTATATSPSLAIEIGEMLVWGAQPAISIVSGVDDALRLATDGVPSSPGVPGAAGTYKAFSMGTVATSGTPSNNDMQTLADALNKALRGYGLEAVRSDLGQLWVRATVAGYKSQMDLDSQANGSTAATKLGLPTSVTQKVGTTVPVLKLPPDALTIMYRCAISGDLPVS